MIDPDDLPKKKIAHEMGQDLSLLSVAELGERIGFLKEEIARLGSGNDQKARLAKRGECIFQKMSASGFIAGATRLLTGRSAQLNRKRIGNFLQFLNLSLSFLVHYSNCPSSGHRVAPVHSV